MTCEKCGRDDGHWLGCTDSSKPLERLKAALIDLPDKPESDESHEMCAYAGCSRNRASKHPRALFCAHHKDPKNRSL